MDRELQGVDRELDLVGGKAKEQRGRISPREGAVELAGEGVEVWCEGARGGGRVGD